VEPVTLFSDGEALSNGAPPLIYGDGRQDRDFGGEVFNVSACGETSILELFETLREVLSSTQQPQLAAARPGEVRRSWGSAEKAHRVLGWPRAGATR
jgi:UDP-glucose 4-epimerase